MVNFATIAVRELRTHARQGTTYRQRAAAGMVAAAIVTVMLIIGTLFSAMRTMGPAMFQTLAWLGFAFCLVEGLRGTVDCLSSEKREGTLGLLFLTELTGFDVVAGKFMVHATASFYRLFAALPALAIPFVIGGVTGGEFWRMMLALLNTLFFSLALGMVISACGRSEQRVWGTGLTMLGLFAVALPLADQVLAGAGTQKAVALFGLFGPQQAFHDSAAVAYRASPTGFWMALGASHLVAWMFLMASGWLLARNWNQMHDTARPSRWDRFFRRKQTRALGTFQTAADPLTWLAGQDANRWHILWLVAAILAGAGALMWCARNMKMEADWVVVGIIFWLLHWGLRLWAAVQACSAMATLKASGLMELLLVAPVSHERVIRSLIFGLNQKNLPVLGALAVLQFFGWMCMAIALKTGFALAFGLIVWAFSIAILAADLCAINYGGLWYSLVLPKTTSAITRTITRVLLLPLLMVVLLPFGFCGFGVPIFFIIKGVLITNHMRDRLEKQFRLVATQSLFAPAQAASWWRFFKQTTTVPAPPLLPTPAIPTVRCSICGQWVDLKAEFCPCCKWPFTKPDKSAKK